MSSLALEFPRRAVRDFLHRIEVPRDIKAVTHIDAAAECDPLEAGIAHKQAAAIWRDSGSVCGSRRPPSTRTRFISERAVRSSSGEKCTIP